jgi:hypothetical protein
LGRVASDLPCGVVPEQPREEQIMSDDARQSAKPTDPIKDLDVENGTEVKGGFNPQPDPPARIRGFDPQPDPPIYLTPQQIL